MKPESLLLLLFLLIPVAVIARTCVDNVNGLCETDTWCFHNKSSGEFNCDAGRFCAGLPKYLGKKKSSECFISNKHNLCCCNDKEGCNIDFAKVKSSKEKKHTQKCIYSFEDKREDEPKILHPCDDPWCYSFLDSERMTTVRGCQSKTLMKNHLYNQIYQKFGDDYLWKDSGHLIGVPRCDDILLESDRGSVNASRCIHLVRTDSSGVEHVSQFCCCRGTDMCNEKLDWEKDKGREMRIGEQKLRVRPPPLTTEEQFEEETLPVTKEEVKQVEGSGEEVDVLTPEVIEEEVPSQIIKPMVVASTNYLSLITPISFIIALITFRR